MKQNTKSRNNKEIFGIKENIDRLDLIEIKNICSERHAKRMKR